MKIAIITGTVRKNRKSIGLAQFIKSTANKKYQNQKVSFEILDIKDFDLPLFNEALPPATLKTRENERGQRWSDAIASYDALIFLTAEYNRSIPGSLKNALDYLGREISGKVAGIVSYGSTGGQSAADNLRLVLSRLGLKLVRSQPYFVNSEDFDTNNDFLPLNLEKSQNKVLRLIDAIINY